MKTYRLIVKGRVQGVSYRYFAQKNARQLGVKGYVRNLENGDVEVVAQADEALFLKFLQILQKGPLLARVDRIESSELGAEFHFNDFTIEF